LLLLRVLLGLDEVALLLFDARLQDAQPCEEFEQQVIQHPYLLRLGWGGCAKDLSTLAISRVRSSKRWRSATCSSKSSMRCCFSRIRSSFSASSRTTAPPIQMSSRQSASSSRSRERARLSPPNLARSRRSEMLKKAVHRRCSASRSRGH